MIEIEQDGAIATIRLARPARRNAFAVADWRALADVVAGVTAAAIVLRSADPAIFSAGADIGELAGLADDPAARVRFREAMRAGIDAIADAPAPVIAFVEGGCFGAAVALAAAADIRVAAPAAVFAITPAKLGIGYPPADVARIVTLVGRGQAVRLLLSAHPVDAAEAARIGLVDVVADDPLPLAQAIAAHPPGTIALLQRTIRGEATDAEFDAAFGGAEFAAGLAAFRARRG